MPKSPESLAVLPSHSWYPDIPLPAVQVKVTDEPGRTLPGVGLVRAAAVVEVPVPLRLMTDEAPVEELLAMVSAPVAAPAAVGSNWTVSVAV